MTSIRRTTIDSRTKNLVTYHGRTEASISVGDLPAGGQTSSDTAQKARRFHESFRFSIDKSYVRRPTFHSRSQTTNEAKTKYAIRTNPFSRFLCRLVWMFHEMIPSCIFRIMKFHRVFVLAGLLVATSRKIWAFSNSFPVRTSPLFRSAEQKPIHDSDWNRFQHSKAFQGRFQKFSS